jgi:hypothetical protein
MWNVTVWGITDLHTAFWWGNLRESGGSEELGVDRRIILKWIFKK